MRKLKGNQVSIPKEINILKESECQFKVPLRLESFCFEQREIVIRQHFQEIHIAAECSVYFTIHKLLYH